MDKHFVRYLPESYTDTAFQMLFDNSYEVPLDMHVQGYDLITYAAQSGHMGIVRSLVLDHAWDFNKVNPMGINALYAASMNNRRAIVEQVLCWKADISVFQGEKQWTPLMIASSMGHDHIVALLLAHSTDKKNMANTVSPLTGETALHCAAAKGHVRIVQALLRASNDPERIFHRTKRGVCALDMVIKNGHHELMHHMLTQCEDTLCKHTQDLSYSLMMAVYFQRSQMASYLLKSGTRSTMIMKGGLSPLMVAALKGNVPILTMCVNHACLYTPYDISMSLFFALRKQDTQVADRLNLLIPPHKIIHDPFTLLSMAAEKRHEFWVVALLKFANNIHINTQDYPKKETLLYKMASQGNDKMVKILLDFGADPSITNHQGLTPMYKAASLNHVTTVKRFLNAGVDVNCYDHPNHLTSLFVACCANHEELVDVLMDAGAFPLLETKSTITYRNAYQAAQANGNDRIVARIKVFFSFFVSQHLYLENTHIPPKNKHSTTLTSNKNA